MYCFVPAAASDLLVAGAHPEILFFFYSAQRRREFMQSVIDRFWSSNWMRGVSGAGGEEGLHTELLTGRWAVRCPRCWNLLRLLPPHRRSSPQINPELHQPTPAQDFLHFHPCFSKEKEKINFFYLLFCSFFFLYHWLDLKMALHGLTLRKARADLFDCCFVTVKPALSDWTCFPPLLSFSIFFPLPDLFQDNETFSA